MTNHYVINKLEILSEIPFSDVSQNVNNFVSGSSFDFSIFTATPLWKIALELQHPLFQCALTWSQKRTSKKYD